MLQQQWIWFNLIAGIHLLCLYSYTGCDKLFTFLYTNISLLVKLQSPFLLHSESMTFLSLLNSRTSCIICSSHSKIFWRKWMFYISLARAVWFFILHISVDYHLSWLIIFNSLLQFPWSSFSPFCLKILLFSLSSRLMCSSVLNKKFIGHIGWSK